MLLDLITFKGIKHCDPAINRAVENGLRLSLIKLACLDGSDDFTHIAGHHRLQLVAVCEFVVFALASRFELRLDLYISIYLLSLNLLTKKLPNLSPPAITP